MLTLMTGLGVVLGICRSLIPDEVKIISFFFYSNQAKKIDVLLYENLAQFFIFSFEINYERIR